MDQVRQVSDLSMVQIAQPDADCVVEIFDGPFGFNLAVIFASVPSPEVARALTILPQCHPGIQSLETEAEERIEQIEQFMGRAILNGPRFQPQRSRYQYNCPHIYDPHMFGIAMCDYLGSQFGLRVKFLGWGDSPQFKHSYPIKAND
jgi:hypothetical protein